MTRSSRSPGVMIAVNAVAWLVIHMAFAWGVTRLPLRLFNAHGLLFRPRRWERGGDRYENALHVKRWKDLLPDGALLFAGGFAKGKIAGNGPAYLERYARETCRGESAHWLVVAISPVFFLWNPVWAGVVNFVYACIANVPCIVALRYNRLQLLRILARHSADARKGQWP